MMWSWVGPTKAPPDSITSPEPMRWLSTRPPTRSRASTTSTERPLRATWRAATRPEMPAPTTTTSTFAGRGPLLVAASAAPSRTPAVSAPTPAAAAPPMSVRRVIGVILKLLAVPEPQWLWPLNERARDRATVTPHPPSHRADDDGSATFVLRAERATFWQCISASCTAVRRVSGTADVSVSRPMGPAAPGCACDVPASESQVQGSRHGHAPVRRRERWQERRGAGHGNERLTLPRHERCRVIDRCSIRGGDGRPLVAGKHSPQSR